MSEIDFNIHILKALHGDAFVLNCKKGEKTGVVVVDGGPNKNSQVVVEEYDKIGMIDLLVLTHYDLDHIGGVLSYIAKHKNDKPFPIKEVWCNCAYDLSLASSNISYKQAKKLADLLKEINVELKNSGFPEIEWQESIVSGQVIYRPYADFYILSPEVEIKVHNSEQYVKATNVSYNHKRQKDALQKSLEVLADIPKEEPKASDNGDLVNWSSIAFYLICDNMTSIMLGDSFPCTITKSLSGLGFSKENRLRVDFFKVSHHGCRKNISNELLDMIESNQYIFSTNGGLGTACHPDRETIGNILYHKNRNWNEEVRLYFNYPQSIIESVGYMFLNSGEEDTSKFKAIYNVEYL